MKRAQVLYFGKGVPDPTGDEKSLDFYDPRLVARVFNDAGFSVYSINPQGLVAGTSIGLPTPEVGASMITSKLGRDVLANSSSYAVENWTGNQYLNRWAIDTGGFGFFTNDIRKAVRRVLAETSFYYVLAHKPLELDSVGNYRKIEVKLSRPDLELRHRGGYFATEPGTLELQDRTVLTAFLAPERFQAFPIMTEGRSSAESQLEVLVSFPFGAVEVARTSEGRYLQKITVSFAAFDSADRIIGFEEALFQLDLSESEWQELRQGNATVERTLDIERKRGGPKRLRAVAIVGQNRQIAAAVSDVQLADRSLK